MKRLRSKAVSFVTALFLVLTLLPMLPQGALTADAAGEIIYVSTYDELKDALTDSANTGNTVKMTEDITDVTSIIFASYPMTLDMDGHTLKFDYNYYVYFHVRIYDSSDPFIITGNGTIDGKCGGGIVYRSAGNLKIESGTIKNINEDYGKSINVNDSDYSNITITEGKFISANRLSYDVTITEGSIRDDYDGYTVITDKYGLYVDGVQVTAQNRYDILGGGEASYDIYTKTLTIRKDISNTYFFDPCIENRSIAGLIINIAKDVTINSIWGYTILCNSNTQTTITGKGKLTLKSMYNHAIKTNYNTRLIIIDANIDITTEDFGIYGNGEIYFEHANVTINATDYYAVDHSKGIYLTECYISEPEGGSVELIDTDEETYAITDGSGNKAKTVRIKAICQDSLIATDATKATCTTEGNSAYWTCARCGKHYADSEGINEIENDSWILPPLGHDMLSFASSTPTCTEAGNIAYYYCLRCKKYFSDSNGDTEITKVDTIIPKLGHSLKMVEAKSPTCTKNGNIAYYYCKNCNKCFSDSYANTEIAKEDTVIPRLGHDYIITVVAPTCTKEGYTQHKCSRCNDNYSDDYKDATGHNWSKWKTSKAATCTASGVKTRKCSGCGISQKKTVAKLGHNYVETVVAPTCTAQGYTEHKCSRCGDFYKDTYTKATGHKWSKWRTSKEPTCIADGQQTRTCSLCKKTEKKTISKLGHDYIDTVVKPSCTKRGYTLHKCSRCGDFYKDSNTKAKGHKWSEWNTIKEPTCTADGEHTRTCSVCKKTETETIAMFGHDYIDTIVKPTCLMRGYTIHTCSRCGDTYKDTYTKATGHKFSAWKTTGYNFSKNTSAQTRKCTACGKTENQTTNNAITRIAGANRYETASVISTEMFKQSDTVIVATGLTFHDALVAVPLASAYKAPLLLATEKHITAQTEAELKRLGAKNVIVVSTNGAIGEKAKAELSGYKTTYIEGKTSFETAAKVVKALQTKTKKAPTTIFFATDSAFADALSTSPVAAIKNAPILYLKNTGSIDSATADYLKSVKGKVKNAYVIGGDGVISDAMMKNVASALGLTVNKTVQRVAGKNRYETCVAVNDKFADLLTGEGICVAKGLDFPDALAGGVYAAATKQALFLADGKKLQDCQSSYLKTKNAAKITVFGGTGAVTDELVKIIAKASV